MILFASFLECFLKRVQNEGSTNWSTGHSECQLTPSPSAALQFPFTSIVKQRPMQTCDHACQVRSILDQWGLFQEDERSIVSPPPMQQIEDDDASCVVLDSVLKLSQFL